MKIVGTGQQQVHHYLYDASGTITSGGTAQLVLAQSMSRSFFFFQNNSSGSMWLEFGSARATCTISSGVVNAVTVANAGFNFTKPPVVRFLGGGSGATGGFPPPGNTTFLGGNQPNYPAPVTFAQGHATLSAGAVNAITIDNGGSNYLIAPYVFIFNSDLDPYGCAVPSAGVGILMPSGGPPLTLQASFCTTDPVAVFGATNGQQFTCKWSD